MMVFQNVANLYNSEIKRNRTNLFPLLKKFNSIPTVPTTTAATDKFNLIFKT